MSGTSSNAKYGKGPRKPKEFAGDWRGFVDISLTPEQKAFVKGSLVDEAADIVGLLSEFLDEGYKVSFSPDAAHNCVVATATGRAPGCLNVGLSLSARAGEWAVAVQVLYYKAFVLCGGGMWENFAGDKKWDELA